MFENAATWLPVVFAGLMGLSILIYVVLDGFDLGVGILFAATRAEDERDIMVGSIGPFWDANETWLVLAVGLLLVAFPVAHGIVLTALYLPVAVMLIGLILRGVAFEFRIKADRAWKPVWDRAFLWGSLMTALSQGAMLGLYVMALEITPATLAFSVLTAICVTAGYGLIGATWLIIKTEGDLQRRAAGWARAALVLVAVGYGAISIATPMVSPRIFEKWFSVPEIVALAPLPLMALAILVALWIGLGRIAREGAERFDWLPFLGATGLFLLAFFGLAYSFYPYVVPEQLTIYDAAAAPESLLIILAGTLVVLPLIAGYTVLAYWIFRGKATALRYE